MKVTVEHKGKTYEFRNGSEAYIFDIGTLNDFPEDKLLEYVSFVEWIYSKTDGPTPLGHLCDYIAQHWDEVQELDKWAILDRFYETY